MLSARNVYVGTRPAVCDYVVYASKDNVYFFYRYLLYLYAPFPFGCAYIAVTTAMQEVS